MVSQSVMKLETGAANLIILHTVQDPETLWRKLTHVSHPQTDDFGP